MRRLVVAAAMVWLPVGVLGLTWAAWHGRLPERIATHWNGTGAADGFGSASWFWATLLVVGVAAGVAAAVAARTPGARFLLTAAGAVSGAAAGIWLATARATLANPAEARLGWRFLLVFAGLAWGFVVAAVAGPRPPAAPADVPLVDPLELKPTERVAYSSTLRSPVLLGVSLVAAAVVAVAAATTAPAVWPVLALPLAAALLFARVRVTADRRGLRLVAGLIGVPLKRIALADIDTAEPARIAPMEWGGWGYRVAPGRSALVLRSGPGLVLRLRDGRRFAVTLDEPEVPAALLTALRHRTPG
ncbi:DUF1648 domain-containing protein [Couchioplanes caeruleus]|uniref:DUF1648 domain-containing protein n=1 Tax=Couchioplanes caeruleus TaxID=56438 RepID=UPI0020BE7AAB|nr:DUF1648 domain-containing protein [Couchioplanes caeruleus]UQU63421.1 DUF1648 domain-containing protein [Couchioplanes caeruleus]